MKMQTNLMGVEMLKLCSKYVTMSAALMRISTNVYIFLVDEYLWLGYSWTFK